MNTKDRLAALRAKAAPHKATRKTVKVPQDKPGITRVVPARKQAGAVEVAQLPPSLPGSPRIAFLAPTLENAVTLVQEAGIAYVSLFMTRMGVGLTRAIWFIDRLTEAGVCGPEEGLLYHCNSYRRVWNLKPEARNAR